MQMKRKHLSRISGTINASIASLAMYGLSNFPDELYKKSLDMFEHPTTTNTVLGSVGVATTTLLTAFIYLPLGVIALNGIIDAVKGTRNYLYFQKPPKFIEKFLSSPYTHEERKHDLEDMLKHMEQQIF